MNLFSMQKFSFLFFFKKIRLRQDIRVWSGEQSQRDMVEHTCNPPRWKQRQRDCCVQNNKQNQKQPNGSSQDTGENGVSVHKQNTKLSSLAWRLAQLLLLNLNYSVPEYSLPQGLYPRVISSERPVIFPWACYHYCLYLDF